MTAKRLGGKTAVITGASRGIGALTARTLIAEGAQVVSLSRSAPQTGSGIEHMACDVTKPAAVEAAVEPVRRLLGGDPDILISNAGIFQVGGLDQMSAESFTDILQTNLFGPFFVLRAFLGGMKSRGTGHIVTIGSIADRLAFPENGAYSAAKYGLRGMMAVLRAELKGSGVRSTHISPGSVDTTIWDPILAREEENPGRFPARSVMLRAEDVAAAILFAVTLPRRANVDELRITHS